MRGREREPAVLGGSDDGLFSASKSQAPADYRVLLGSTQLYQHGQHAREVSLSRIIMHPDFEKLHPFGSDITMLQLHAPVNFTSYIAPACLPSPGMQLSGNLSCWITGWGMLTEDREGVWESRWGREGGKTGGKAQPWPPPPPPGKRPQDLGPLCLISRGLDHFSSSSEKRVIP